ncbi:hypothetical protein LPJ66_003897 [Kickxella alabastrina]|uniref:Uncharacterized protein n=1 Tax=Kickxella alabastrina TaxID=61397 RepID=A0ACC1IMM4_9FUNG|nr:hypothetical protein LPJ66_003897 [Kickxella alabastrina]
MSRAPEKKVSKPVATSGVKVHRYFPGKAPEGHMDEFSESEAETEAKTERTVQLPAGASFGASTKLTAATEVLSAPMRIGAGIGNTQQENEGFSDSDAESDGETRRLMQARLLARQRANEEASADSGSDSDSDSGSDTARARLRASMQIRKPEGTGARAGATEASGSGSDSGNNSGSGSSEESGSSSEDGGYAVRPMLKPMFVPKSQRQTQQNPQNPQQTQQSSRAAAMLEDENGEARDLGAEALARMKEARREESVRMAAEEARRAREQPEIDNDEHAHLVDDTDDVDPEAEFEAWKLRELLRIKRGKEEGEVVDLEEQERERRRNMSEAQKYAEDIEMVRKQREEKIERARELRMEYLEEQDAMRLDVAQDSSEVNAIMSQQMFEYAMINAEGRRSHTKWKGHSKEDTSRAGPSLWEESMRAAQRSDTRPGTGSARNPRNGGRGQQRRSADD